MRKMFLVLLSVFIVFFPENSSGQIDSTSTISPSHEETDILNKDSSPSESPDYFFPDIPGGKLNIEGKKLLFNPNFAIVSDYNVFNQDEASLEQVGKQDNAFDFRALRLVFNLKSKTKFKWDFMLMLDYQESRTREEQYFQIYDLRVGIPIGPVKITIGHQKESFIYEMNESLLFLPQQERLLSPFFTARNSGVNLSGTLLENRMTWATGVFNDWWKTGAKLSENATDVVAHVTGLPYVTDDNFNYLHLGLGFRYVGSDNGMMRFSGRPASHMADKYVDTKSFEADHAKELSLEAVFSINSFLIQAEYVDTWVDSPENGNPRFSGAYISTAWTITGESRPYYRSKGFAGHITPNNYWGAIELVTRYGYVNLTDASIDGGKMNQWEFGANWWASKQWKIGVVYALINLDQNALSGNTNLFQSRLVWMY